MNFKPAARKAARGFTLIELLVSVTVSVLLLAILAFVFRISTQATRSANTRIAITERLRSLNIRMRQEIGNMLDKPRTSVKGATYKADASGEYLIFSTATDEDGRPVNVDVKYEFKKGGDPVNGRLIRRRDLTGPYELDADGEVVVDKNNVPKVNAKYEVGDDQFFQDGAAAEKSAASTVMMSNVRSVKFRVIDPPLAPDDAALKTQLNPRTLPAAIEMEIQYGPELGSGDTENLDTIKIAFPIYRGL
jgi:prepilin-type N-terminal cleavage/methylation domain-containing protein